MRTTRPRVQHNTKAACCTTSISVFDSILSVHHTQVPVPTYMISPNPLRHGGFNTDEAMMPSTVSTCTPLSIKHIRRWEKDEKLSRQHGCSPSPSGKTDRMYQAAQRYFGLFPAAVPCRARRSYCSHKLQHAGTNAFSPSQPNELCLGKISISLRRILLSWVQQQTAAAVKSALLSSLRWPFHEKMAVPSGSITHPPIVHRTIP